jgi:hypothetical protein
MMSGLPSFEVGLAAALILLLKRFIFSRYSLALLVTGESFTLEFRMDPSLTNGDENPHTMFFYFIDVILSYLGL